MLPRDLRRWAASPAAVALAAFCVALAAAAVLQPGAEPDYRLSESAAARAALRDATVRNYLAQHDHSRRRVSALDDELQRVTFLDGDRIVLDAAVAPDGRVVATNEFASVRGAYGAPTAHEVGIVVGLTLAFLLVFAGLPILSLRNLDAVALASFAVPIVLLDERFLAGSVYAMYPSLAYLAGRCLWVGLGRSSDPGSHVPFYAWALDRVGDADGGRRLMALATLAAAAMVSMVTITAPGVIDVGLASALGATELLNGNSPYDTVGEEVLHGDTYPLLAYVAYLPAAAISPVRDAFDDVGWVLVMQALAALVAAAGVFVAGRRVGGGRTGLAFALGFLLFPPVLIAASAGSNDIILAACVAWLIALAGRPLGAGIALAAGVWVKLAPLALLPVVAARYRGREAGMFLLGVSLVSAGALVWLVALGGLGEVGDMARAIAFQLERGSLRSAWGLLGADVAQMIVQAAALGLIVGATVAALRRPRPGGVPGTVAVAGLAGAVLIALQIGASNLAYLYLPWIIPCAIVALFAPATAGAGATGRAANGGAVAD